MSNYTLHLTCNTGIGKHPCRNVPAGSQVTSSIGPICKIVEKELGDFKPMSDYLLLSGDPVVIGVACAFVSDVTSGFFRVLKWDRLEEHYRPILINLWGSKNEQ